MNGKLRILYTMRVKKGKGDYKNIPWEDCQHSSLSWSRVWLQMAFLAWHSLVGKHTMNL